MERTVTKTLSTKALVLCGMFTALVAVGAFIQIPVPYMDYFTLQFFFVLLAGIILGGKKGALAVGCYVALGLMGIPIFAAGGGIGYIFRPSFGYLLGFIGTAFVTGTICDKRKNSYGNFFAACLAGFAVTYAIGILYKYMILNFYADTPATMAVIFLSCFPLDMPGDFVLCILASGIGLRLKKSGFGLDTD
ncbi:MAG: biotin transporter BioY [Dorea sp.]|nr:biotin transporter BioY [Dorea sp.]